MVVANPKNKFIERIIDAARERKRQRLWTVQAAEPRRWHPFA